MTSGPRRGDRSERQFRPGTEFRNATCPTCGMQRGIIKRIGEAVRNAWDFVRDPAKPLGVIQSSSGRGTLRTIGTFGPDDDPDEFYPRVKRNLLAGLREWRDKGWLTDEEIEEALQ